MGHNNPLFDPISVRTAGRKGEVGRQLSRRFAPVLHPIFNPRGGIAGQQWSDAEVLPQAVLQFVRMFFVFSSFLEDS